MGDSKRMRMGDKRSFISLLLVFCLLFSSLSTFLIKPAEAKSTRTAIVVEAGGEVSVRKAGGSKTYSVYTDMSLNQGDVIITGADGYAVLRIADHEDEITIDANAEVNISDLSDQGDGKVSKLKMFAGSVWVKVKSLVSSEDEFEVETPTAVMGVRGTNWWQTVDPVTGKTGMVVASGVIRASTATVTENEGTNRTEQQGKQVFVYPAQQIVLDSRTETPDLRTKVNTVNVGDLVNNASPKVIEKIIRGVADIQQENAMLREKLINDLNNGIQKPTENSNLQIKDLNDLNKVTGNFDNLIGNIAKQAIDAKKLEKAQIDKIIEEANKTITDPAKKLDLDKIQQIDPNAGLDPEVEQAKQAAAEAQARFAEEQRQLIENQQRLAALLSKIEADKKAMDEANKQAAKEAAEKAAEQLKSQLDEAARRAFEESRKKNEQQQQNNNTGTVTPPSSGGSSGSSGGNRNNTVRPSVPVLVSPVSAITTEAPSIVARAESNAVILVLNNGVKIAEAQGNGSQDVTISLSGLAAGSYDKLTIVTERSGLRSSAVQIPVITVTTKPDPDPAPESPVLVSPTATLVTNYPTIVARATANAKIIVLDGGNVLKEANGQGNSDVSIPLGYLQDGTYSKLTIVSEVNGRRSATVTVPEIKVDSTMAITLKAEPFQAGTGKATLKLYMNNFVEAKHLYAAEAHLVYSTNALHYAGSNELSPVTGTVFGSQSQSAETLKEHSSSTESELIYAASNYDSASATSSNFQVSGEQLLVTVPLTVSSSLSSTETSVPVKLVYYKVVSKDGATVAEFNGIANPKVINVPVK